MSRTLKIYLLVFAVLIAVMIAIDQSREKPLNWSPTYHLDEKKPLDLYVLNREIDDLSNDSVVRYGKNPFEYFQQHDSLNIKKETYLFIKQYVYIDEALANRILNAVRQGSTLFIVSDGFTPYLTDTLKTTCEYACGHADTASATALGYMTFPDGLEYINFMEFEFGKGKIILHNQPVIFSNYSLLYDEALQEYAERVLSYLPDQPVVWFVDSQQNGGGRGKTPLSVIFNYPALRMTWLIFLYGLIVFLFFTAKRKQRVVPVIKPLKNTTVEFAQTIGNLYFQEGDISDIARKKIIYFLDRVRRTYNIDTQLPEDKLIHRLQLKSGKDIELIREILSLIREVEHQNRCGKQELIQLSTLMDRFWDDTAT